MTPPPRPTATAKVRKVRGSWVAFLYWKGEPHVVARYPEWRQAIGRAVGWTR